MPDDKQWAADRATILQGLGVLDPEGKPTDRLAVVKAADVARLTQEDWQKERDKMVEDMQPVPFREFCEGRARKRRPDDQGSRPFNG